MNEQPKPAEQPGSIDDKLVLKQDTEAKLKGRTLTKEDILGMGLQFHRYIGDDNPRYTLPIFKDGEGNMYMFRRYGEKHALFPDSPDTE